MTFVVDDVTFLDDHQRRHGLHVRLIGEVLVLVDVDLAEEDVGVSLRGLVEDRAEGAARAAPSGVEVEERECVVLHCLCESLFCDFLNCHSLLLHDVRSVQQYYGQPIPLPSIPHSPRRAGTSATGIIRAACVLNCHSLLLHDVRSVQQYYGQPIPLPSIPHSPRRAGTSATGIIRAACVAGVGARIAP